jgi:hypothetical protein
MAGLNKLECLLLISFSGFASKVRAYPSVVTYSAVNPIVNIGLALWKLGTEQNTLAYLFASSATDKKVLLH